MTDQPLSSKIVFDTTDFTAGVREINRQIRVVESGFRAAAAGMEDWEKSSAGLEKRIKSLNGEMDLQKQKVEGLQGVYDKLAAEGKTSAKEMEELQIRINKETETLGKMQTELNQSTTALDNLGKETDDAGVQMDELATNTGKAGTSLDTLKTIALGLGGAMAVGATAIAAMGAAAIAAAKGITDLVLSSAEMAGELVDAANKTGLSVERLQELAFIGEQVGVSTDTITGALSKMTRNMDAARDGSEKQAEAFKTLGINLLDANGNLRDSETVFQETLTALGGVANETERDALAMELFGKSAMELNPLIKTSAKEMDAMTKKAHEIGAVVSTETVNGLESFGDTLAGLQAGLKGTAAEVAGAFLPAFQSLTGVAETYLGQFGEIVRGADGDLVKMADGIGGLLGTMVTDLAKQLPAILKAGLGIVQGIIEAIVSALPELLPAAVSIITSLVEFLVANLPMIIDAGVQLILALVQGIVPMLPLLIEAAMQILITLATGITQALPTLIPAIVEVIPQIILTLLENLPLLIDAALQLILALATGLVAAIPILVPYIPQIVQAIFDTIMTLLPIIAEAAVQIIVTLVNGIIESLPMMIAAAGQVINAYVNGIKSLLPKLLEVGKFIVVGVWNGIKDNAQWLFNNVAALFGNLVEVVKGILGISSPSLVFASIGENMALGMGQGFARSFAGIERDIQRSIDGMSADGSIGLTMRAANKQAQPSPVTVYVNVGSIDKDIDIYNVANLVVSEIQRWQG